MIEKENDRGRKKGIMRTKTIRLGRDEM